MLVVTGNNLYRQWFSNDYIFSEFRSISKNVVNSYSEVKLIQINWSYNIFQIGEDTFYVTGFINNKDSIKKLKLPKCNPSNLSIVGNDYKLIFIEKSQCKLWIMDFETENEFKTVNLNVEGPAACSEKRKKVEDCLAKINLFGDCLIYLTEEGNVYSGLLPSLVDTNHCLGKVIDVQCGYEHFILLTDAGWVYSWGNGRRLQLGHGDVSNLDTPTEVEALAGINITKISAGGWHSFALSEFGDLYAWGWNDTGQLGIKAKEKNSYSIPTLVDIFDGDTETINKNVKDIACGTKHTAILLEDYSIWTSGSNKYGQLGFTTDLGCVHYFRKAYQCDVNAKLMCGPWTTVILN